MLRSQINPHLLGPLLGMKPDVTGIFIKIITLRGMGIIMSQTVPFGNMVAHPGYKSFEIFASAVFAGESFLFSLAENQGREFTPAGLAFIFVYGHSCGNLFEKSCTHRVIVNTKNLERCRSSTFHKDCPKKGHGLHEVFGAEGLGF